MGSGGLKESPRFCFEASWLRRWASGVGMLGMRISGQGLGFRGLGLGFRGLGFRGLGVRGLTTKPCNVALTSLF